MACLYKMNAEQQRVWDKWLASRPPLIQELAAKYPPNHLFRLGAGGHRVRVRSYEENGTVTVEVSAEHNDDLIFERHVFGVNPADLIEAKPNRRDRP